MTKPQENSLNKKKANGNIQIFLVDDHPIVREGLSLLLESQPGYEVCGQATDPQEALEAARMGPIDILVLDLSLRDSNGLDLLVELRKNHPKIRVIILSMHGEPELVRRALKLDAAGYIRKQDAPDQLLTAISRVLQDEVYLPGPLARIVLQAESPTTRPTLESKALLLTLREKEILRLFGEGKGNSEIANALKLSLRTVDTYQTNLKRKLNVTSARELIIHAASLLKNGKI